MTQYDEPGTPGPAGVFMRLAQIVHDRARHEDVYSAICQAAVDTIPGCDRACISVLRGGEKLGCLGATDQIAEMIDGFESRTGQGPCLDAILEEGFQHDTDIAERSAWPELRRLVLEHTPVRGMIGYRIVVGGHKAGALNVFSDTPGALTAASADMGAIVSSFASIALAGTEHNERAEQLQRGLESNREIGKAIGLLMATHNIGEDEAFGVLRKASSELNIKLVDIAGRVVDEHR